MTDKYILDENHNVIPSDLMEWSEWLENCSEYRIVKQEDIGGYWVSTVFIGLDHNFNYWLAHKIKNEDYKPHIFETMIFYGEKRDKREDYCTRCSTWQEAQEQHEDAIKWLKENKDINKDIK